MSFYQAYISSLEENSKDNDFWSLIHFFLNLTIRPLLENSLIIEHIDYFMYKFTYPHSHYQHHYNDGILVDNHMQMTRWCSDKPQLMDHMSHIAYTHSIL